MLANVMAIPKISAPQLAAQSCLNSHLPEQSGEACTRCRDICLAKAIELSGDQTSDKLPMLDASICTGCTACVSICPTDAMRHADVRPAELVRQVIKLRQMEKTDITAACCAVDRAHADLTLPCHAAWTPVVLASLAAEGIRSLHLDGINQCANCSMQFGAEIMQQTEKDYAALNHALGIRLTISHKKIAPETIPTVTNVPEPERRAFFRNLVPSITQGAVMASVQISQAARLSGAHASDEPNAKPSLLPVRLQLFLRALPRLQSNFTPIPAMASLPLGAIQADARCNACGACVEQCPTDALYLKEFGDNKVLEFKPDACIGCSHCINICPEQALEPLPSISLPAILTRKSRPLVMITGSKITEAKKQPT